MAAVIQTQASSRYRFTVSHTDNSIWQFTSVVPSPENPTYFGSGGTVGTNVVAYGGHLYGIDVAHHPVRITVDGQPGPELIWNGSNIAVTAHYGWCIINGQGWLASQDNDGDPQNYLFRVNFVTGDAVFIDFIGPVSPTFSISGMVAEPLFP